METSKKKLFSFSLLPNGVGSILLGILLFIIAFYMRNYHIDCECLWQTFTHGIFIGGVLLYLLGFILIVLHLEKKKK